MERPTRLLPIVCLALAAATAAAADWPQWGGPGRDFQVADPGLATAWPEAGLVPLWSRPLGEGFSAIAVHGDRLYTQYNLGEDREAVVALATATGEEVWTREYVATRPDGMRLNYGEGPHATPLVVAGRVFAVGTTGHLLALDAARGEMLWRRDLWSEYGGFRLRRGYGASPIAHRVDGGDAVIVPVGGEGPGAIAFAQDDGRVLWRSESGFDGAQSSPILVENGERTQLVLFVQDEIVGLDASDGTLLWRHPHKVTGPYNITTPVAGPDGTLFFTSAYGGGSRMLRLRAGAYDPQVEELWQNTRMGVHFTNAVRIGDHIYGSTGRSSSMVAALDVRDGELAWKDRAIGRANYLVVGERALALEADGRLLLVELSPEGPSILAQSQLLEAQTWTVPTLVGHTLYVRDRERILAVELPLADR